MAAPNWLLSPGYKTWPIEWRYSKLLFLSSNAAFLLMAALGATWIHYHGKSIIHIVSVAMLIGRLLPLSQVAP